LLNAYPGGADTLHMMRGRLSIAAVALLTAACGSGLAGEPLASASPDVDRAAHLLRLEPQTFPRPEVISVDTRPRFQGFDSAYREEVTLAALAEEGVKVFESKGASEPFLVLPETTIIGSTTVVSLVSAPVDGWAEVRLPIRPNGTTGWIRTDAVKLYVVSGRIEVDLSDRRLTYYENGREALSVEVGVGSSYSPTPVGHFYVTDSVTLTRKGTPWGPHALGLSARSDEITSFNGGDGIIGIHGTSSPASIGGAVSLGCLRLDNDMITRLHALVPIGTPVEIRA